MSEPIGIELTIGGNLPASLVDEFLECVNDDIEIGNGNLNREDLENLNDSLTIYGNADYGMCAGVHDFCIKHGLTFIANVEACGEYNACTTFFVPGMEESETYDTDSNENAVLRTNQIRPLFDFMLALLERADKALPLFLNNPAITDLVKECLERKEDIPTILKEHIKTVLPNEAPDTAPPLVIDESK